VTKRILFVGQTGALGGAELMLFDVASHYRHRCHVALLADGPLRAQLAAAGVSVSVLAADNSMLGVGRAAGPLRVLGAAPAILQAVRRLAKVARDFDILYPNSQKAALIALIVGRLIGKPVVWHLHDILTPDHFGAIQRRVIVSLANRSARWVIANSRASRDAFVAAGGNAKRISVAPNGFDARSFDGGVTSHILPLRPEIGAKARLVVGMFGRISPWKGQHVLVEALTELPDVHAVIVGAPLFGEEAYHETVAARASSLGVADRIEWLGFRKDIPQLMHAVDVVVHCSVLPEPFGRVIVEGMLARRLVVATSLGAAAEVLGEGYDHLVPPNDPVALAAALRRISLMPAQAIETQIAVNHRRALELFSTERMLSEIDDALARAA
jgi:glycosyltransferase involved in cell wall biosynthesis